MTTARTSRVKAPDATPAATNASFDPNQPVDIAQLAPECFEDSSTAPEPSPPPAAEPLDVRQLLKHRREAAAPPHAAPFQKPKEPRLSDSASSRLAAACGSAAELRALEARAADERKAGDDEARRLEADRDAEIARVTKHYAQQIAAARSAGKATSDAVVAMKAARAQVIETIPDWLKKQQIARTRAIATAHHQGTSVLESEVQRKRSFVHPPNLKEGLGDYRTYPRVHQKFAEHVVHGHDASPFKPYPGASVDAVLRHLQKLHATWSAELPELERRLAENQAAKQADIDRAEDELIAAAIECL